MMLRALGRALGLVLAIQAALCVCSCSTTRTYISPDERLADEALAAMVKDALWRDPMLYDAHITVTAEGGGVVRLSGVLSEAGDFYEVRRIAKAVPGVTRVVNDLRLVDRR